MARVEHAQLHQLVRADIVDHQHARLLQRRPAIGEVVLDHPGAERLGHHRPPVVDTEVAAHLGGHLQSRCGSDAVDHRVGERAVFADPFGQLGIDAFGAGQHGPLGDLTVVLDVVARHDGRGGDSLVTTPGERLGDQRERGTVGIAVAAFGDGQRNDPGRRRSQHLQRRLRIVGSITVIDDRPDHLGVPGAVGVLQDQRVQPVLVGEDVAHGPVGGHHADAADAPFLRQSLLQQQVDVGGLVRAVEVAGADMRDADADAWRGRMSARRSAGLPALGCSELLRQARWCNSFRGGDA